MADPGVIVPEVAPGTDDLTAMDLAEEEEEDEDDFDDDVALHKALKRELEDDMISSLPPMVSITRVPKVKPAEPTAATPALKIRSDLGGGPVTPSSSRGTPPPLLRVGALPPRPSLPPMPRLRLGAVRGTGPARGVVPSSPFPLNGMMNHHLLPYSAESLMNMHQQQQQRPVMSQAMMMATNAQLGLPVISGTMSLSRGAMQQQQRQLASLQQQQQLVHQQQQRQHLAGMQQQQRMAAMQQQRSTGLVRQRTTFNPSMLPTVNRPVQVRLKQFFKFNIY